jgi:hypothetical protein
MALWIDDVEAVLRPKDGFDIDSFDRPSHHAKVHLFRLNETKNVACNDVPEIEYDVRPLLAKAQYGVREDSRGNGWQRRQSDDAPGLGRDIARAVKRRVEILKRPFERRNEVARDPSQFH